MHLVLGLPGLLAAGESLPELPGLARLLRAAGAPAAAQDAVPHALAAHFGLARAGDWPLAAVRLRAQGGDPAGDWWLAAHPVTLVAGRDDVRVAGAVADLSADDAASLVGRLNAHFATDGLRFVAATPRHWFLGSTRPYAMTTRPLTRALGAPLLELLPRGPDARIWRRWESEIEMLLHDHPVNVRREAQARAAVNGLWLCDGGALPAPPRPMPGRVTLAHDDAVRALAAHAGEAHADVPGSLAAARAAAAAAPELVAVVAADADPAAIEANWTLPAWQALAAGALSRVTLVADGRGGALRWEVFRPGLATRVALRFAVPKLRPLLALPAATA